MALSEEEHKIYMSLSNDPNERGRLWRKMKLKKSCGEFIEEFIESLTEASKDDFGNLRQIISRV